MSADILLESISKKCSPLITIENIFNDKFLNEYPKESEEKGIVLMYCLKFISRLIKRISRDEAAELMMANKSGERTMMEKLMDLWQHPSSKVRMHVVSCFTQASIKLGPK